MNVYEIITEEILKKLESGEVPWLQPWTGGGYPKNLVSKKEYRGINVFMLSCSRYTSPYWVSYKQAQELGGNVKKGEKSTIVVFWKQIRVKDNDGEVGEDGELSSKTLPFLRYYRVFNVEQCEGLDDKVPNAGPANPDFQPIEACESVVDGMPNRPEIQHQEPRAYYHPKNDFVNMPNKENFDKEEFYYSVLFHELGHSTGHEKRLSRKKQDDWSMFGSEKYSKEELVAEMTAAFLCGHCGIERETIDNSAAYIQNWSKRLKEDKKMIVLAAAQAQKAADYIRGIKHE